MISYFIGIGTVAAIYIILALGLNLQYGIAGLINFGHVAFFAVGAYVTAILSLAATPVPIAISLGVICAGIVAWPISLLSLRLSDDYLAIVTLCFGEALRIVIQQESQWTGGIQGLPGIPQLFAAFTPFTRNALLLLATIAAIFLIYVFLRHLLRSPYGRVITAIRDNEMAAAALGKEVARIKVEVFIVGAAFAGLAGGFYSSFMTYLSADQFIPLITFYIWAAIIIGGVGSTLGSVIGGLLLVIFLEGTRFLGIVFPDIESVRLASLRLAVVGAILLFCTMYFPKGIVGHFKRDQHV